MNQKIIDLLPKKKDDNYNMPQDWIVGYNRAIKDVITSLEKANVGIVPSEEELVRKIADYTNKNSLLYDGCKGLAKAIRNLMIGESEGK